MRAVMPSAYAVAAAAAIFGSPLAAQRRELTIVAGANYSGATGGSVVRSKSRAGFQAGMSLRIPRSSQLSFQTELLIIARRIYGERAPSSSSPSFAGPKADAANLVYAQIPLLLRLQKGYSTERPVRPFFVLGPYLGLRVGCTRQLTAENGATSATDCMQGSIIGGFVPANYQEIDAGVLGELGVEVRQFSLRLRGERSVRNVVNASAVATSPLENARLWSASVSLEYLLKVL